MSCGETVLGNGLMSGRLLGAQQFQQDTLNADQPIQVFDSRDMVILTSNCIQVCLHTRVSQSRNKLRREVRDNSRTSSITESDDREHDDFPVKNRLNSGSNVQFLISRRRAVLQHAMSCNKFLLFGKPATLFGILWHPPERKGCQKNCCSTFDNHENLPS